MPIALAESSLDINKLEILKIKDLNIPCGKGGLGGLESPSFHCHSIGM